LNESGRCRICDGVFVPGLRGGIMDKLPRGHFLCDCSLAELVVSEPRQSEAR
jgi:hypothetical protein